MDRPDVPHVRHLGGAVYAERAPGAWVWIADEGVWAQADEPVRRGLLRRGLALSDRPDRAWAEFERVWSSVA